MQKQSTTAKKPKSETKRKNTKNSEKQSKIDKEREQTSKS